MTSTQDDLEGDAERGAESELWLAAEPGPAPDALAGRVAYWEGLERAFLAHAPAGLRWGALPTARPPAPHARSERWLPLELLRDEVAYLLEEWFGPALAALEVDLATSSLGRARSWLDARAQLPSLGEGRLPSQLLRRCERAETAQALLFELFAAPRLGRGLTRHPDSLRTAAALATASGRPLRAWDAGCASGESTWALARALVEAGAREVEVLGTSPWPLELLMAERCTFPHDPERSRAFQEAAAAARRGAGALRVHFARGDLLQGTPAGSFDLICCHGLLGGAISGASELRRALAHLAGALRAGGVLSIQDTFRDDVQREVLSCVREALGWPEPHPGVFLRSEG